MCFSVGIGTLRTNQKTARRRPHTQKPLGVNPNGFSLLFVAWRLTASSEVERSRACVAMGRTASMRRECVASVSGPTTPDSSDAVTSDDVDQASVAVLSRHVKLAFERLPAQ
jgi:hypothetical protein